MLRCGKAQGGDGRVGIVDLKKYLYIMKIVSRSILESGNYVIFVLCVIRVGIKANISLYTCKARKPGKNLCPNRICKDIPQDVF